MKEKIGVIARYTGLAAHTIKYYENMGLIDNVRDEQSNYRYYELNQRTIIHECMHYRKLDFPIKDIEYMIKEASADGINDCFSRHLEQLDQQIERLQEIRKKVQKTKDELEEWDEKENEWFVEEVEPVLIYWQTEGIDWVKGRECENAGIDYEKYDTRTFAQMKKESLNEDELSYRWGIGIDKADYTDEAYAKDLVECFTVKRAYVTFVKVDEAIASGKIMKILDRIFIEGKVFDAYPGDIYFRRLKMVMENGRAVSYYKVMIPAKQP